MRTQLKIFRISQHLSQDEMAQKIGVSRITYGLVERGKRDGDYAFWSNIKFIFDVPDKDMWKLQQLDEERTSTNEKESRSSVDRE